ncbi:CLUMA_CG009130, isoform A [Clunio marinus]|uniref:CLUMA_CG009130, isoform A n=1 Tax=Clunio marinus TaxID=568069 RepID=A0A1J1I5X4_9DIPT|nr:CLUMA_CG009130, isoform A [Clunio marinus]
MSNESTIIAMALQNERPKLLGWNLPQEDMSLLHSHWQAYEAPPFYYHLLLAVIYFFLMITSTVGNGIVVWIFSTTKTLRSPSNMFIVNLAIFDLCMMLEMPMLLYNSGYQRIIGGDLACTIYSVFGSFSGIGGSATNAAIAYDRYKAISSPLDGKMNKGQAFAIIIITWLWTMPFTILPALKIWGRYIPEGFLTTCSFDFLTDDEDTRVFVACIFVWAYCIPMILIMTFYSKLFSHVKAHEKMLRDQARRMNVQSLSANKDDAAQTVEIRIAKACFTIFFLFVCAWTPYAIVALIGAFGNRSLLTPLTTMIPAVAAKIVSCIDPWVYAISHPRYRAALEKKCPWLGIKEDFKDNVDTKSVTTNATTET